MGIRSFPTEGQLERRAAATPDFMRPDVTPYAVWFEGFLTGPECDEIQETLGLLEPYRVPNCGAVTRECVAAPCLDWIENFARMANNQYWGYDLDPGQHSWMQTYSPGGAYQRHMDGSPGQMRKLTAVAMLSEPHMYEGGDLRMIVNPKSQKVPRTRGTIVVFQPWIEHEVSPVTSGTRQTINMGFWGPPFR